MISLENIIRKCFGSSNDRRIKKMQPMVAKIGDLENEMQRLSDQELQSRTSVFRQQISNGASLDDLLVPAFAVVRETAKRTLKQRHYDVQLIGGMILHSGSISEMRTGEGKTLVSTLAVYLNALSGKGVHVVTVNDYLAERDAAWMGAIYNFLGMSVGVIVNDMDEEKRRQAYSADITYGTNNEFGFDYLRDNMKFELQSMVQRGHSFAIVDEVDSILIDEARTPLIISGPLGDQSNLYLVIQDLMRHVEKSDYELDEKQRTVSLTDKGNEKFEQKLSDSNLLKGNSLYDLENVVIVHHINNALKAHTLFTRDKDYIVRNDEVILIDEFTGRMTPGRRYSEGLHQALEAKEKVTIQPENQTLASITFQNYFRMYEKLAGMTGTASTEAEEFGSIYGLDVIEVPTNLPVIRIDEDDEIYQTENEKYRAIIKLIKECQKRNQPVLVGTTSIEKSEILASLLKKAKINNFQVLNARYHEQEAVIVAQAGIPGAITIATNMAGRGTDVQLGGNVEMRIEQELSNFKPGKDRDKKETEIYAEVKSLKEHAIKAGGLYVIGTERHESRRIDNQLRGRSGRQGDPGHSKFFLSLEDDLMRIFGSNRIDSMLKAFGLKEDEAIVHPWVSKALERAQKKVEAHNFDIRKNLLKYDDVMNDQRKVVFKQRIGLIKGEDISETITDMRHQVIEDLIDRHIPAKSYTEHWNLTSLKEDILNLLNMDIDIDNWALQEGIDEEEMYNRLINKSDIYAKERFEKLDSETSILIGKSIMLQSLDRLWCEHLVSLEHLRSVIGFRGYAQRDPLNEYKSESFEMFQNLLVSFRQTVTKQIMQIKINEQDLENYVLMNELPEKMIEKSDTFSSLHTNNITTNVEIKNKIESNESKLSDSLNWGKTGRNKPCPCGSGKKYKHCHGKVV